MQNKISIFSHTQMDEDLVEDLVDWLDSMVLERLTSTGMLMTSLMHSAPMLQLLKV